MAIERINPDGLHPTPGYHHITVVPAGRLAFLAGQCPLDASGQVVAAGDFLPQVDQVVENTMRALAAVSAGPEHVVRTVIYVVTDGKVVLSSVWNRFLESPLAPAFTTASTLLGVTRLGYDGQVIELDVTAALP
jgi:enamine deaminase RidA (YjgF/YER057c/UK114 family)